jgi:phosphodiesterase/alkaline phosphatase D-like protein
LRWRNVASFGFFCLSSLYGVLDLEAQDLVRGPYLQLGARGQMTVVWKTDTDASGVVDYGTSPSMDDFKSQSGGNSKVHVVKLTGLSSNTLYHYRVVSNGDVLADNLTFRTFPSNSSDGSFLFAVWGDSGTGESEQAEVADRIELIDPDLCLIAGDIVYQNGEAENFDPKYFEPYSNLLASRNLYTTLGNHDVGTSNGQPYIDAFYLPKNNPQNTERYYSFNYGNVHVIGLDTTQSFDVGSDQYNWLEQDLATMGGFWTFVFHHHTPYTTSTTHANSPEGAAIRVQLVPLFDLYGVDLNLAGHTHGFERTYPAFADAVVSSGQDPNYTDPGGTIYVTTGGGGRRLYNHDTEHPNNDYLVTFIKEYHVTTLDVDNTRITGKAIERDGTVLDTFTLTKTPDTTAPLMSGIDAIQIIETKATIVWATDELTATTLDYGMTGGFDNEVNDPFRMLSHSVPLTGLSPGTQYQYRVSGVDRTGNSTTSGTLFFMTSGDVLPPVISGLSATNIAEIEATIVWTTDEDADSSVQFGLTPKFDATRNAVTLVQVHTMDLSGLLPGEEYQYRVTSTDAVGNSSTSVTQVFVTEADTVPPVISDAQASSIEEEAATIEWTTDEGATSLIDYGVSAGNLSQDVLAAELVTSHSLSLSGLQSDTEYFYRLTSEDELGNDASSAVLSFTTLPDVTGPVVSNVAALDLTETQARITWSTNEAADSFVEYGINTAFGQEEFGGGLVKEHSVLLTGIFPGLEYHYQVVSADVFGNKTTGPSLTFITEGDPIDPHSIAYWRLDNNLLDEAAGVRHGTASGAQTFSTDVPAANVPQTGAENARSYSFDGTASVTFPDSALDLIDSNSATIECFLRTTILGTNQVFFYQGEAGGDGFGPEDALQLYLTGAGAVGILQFQEGLPNIFILSAQALVNSGAWHHVAVTLDGTEANLYLDGTLVGTDSAYLPIDKTGWEPIARLGGPALSESGDGFSGEVDELRISDEPIVVGQFLSTETVFRFEVESPGTVERTDVFTVSLQGTSTSEVHGFTARLLFDPDRLRFLGSTETAFGSTVWVDAERQVLDVNLQEGTIDVDVLREAVAPINKRPLGPFSNETFAVLTFEAAPCTGEVIFSFDDSDPGFNSITVEEFGQSTKEPSVESNLTTLVGNETFIRGDATASMPIDPDDPEASITLADGVFLLTAFYLDGPEPPCLEAADANADGRLNVIDAILVLQHVFGNPSTDSLPPPWPTLGRAPAPSFDCNAPPPSVCD